MDTNTTATPQASLPTMSNQVAIGPKSSDVVIVEGSAQQAEDGSSSQRDLGQYVVDLKRQSETVAVKTNYLTLYRYASISDLMILLVSLVCAAGSGAALPLMTVIFGQLGESFQQLFNGTIDPRSFEAELDKFVLYFVYLAVAEWVVAYISTVGTIYIGERITGKTRERYLESILRHNVAYFDQLGAGEITTRITADCNLIQDGISQKTALMTRAIATFVAAFVIGFIKSWKLTLIIAGAIAAIGLTMSLGSIYAMKVNQHSIQAYAQGGSVAEEAISSIRNAAAFGTQAKLAGQYDEHLQEAEKWGLKMKKIMGMMWSVVMCFMFLSYGLGFWVGGIFVADGSLTLSDTLTTLMALMTAAISLGQMGPWSQAFSTATAAAAKIFSSIDRQSPMDVYSPVGLKPKQVEGNIDLRNVTHIYPSRPDVVVMKDFNLHIPAGKSTALVGASGSGKSTVVSLIERFYEPVKGDIMLDGRDIRTLNLHWLRQQVSLVQQEPVLFATTIFENIRHGLTGTKYENADEETIQKLVIDAAEKANAHDFVSALEEGYETNVGSRGFLLSGGQKQRIAIARAIISDPCILLLDEATSALDTKSELVVQNALEKASQGRTTIIIAHRLSTIRNADNIVVMAAGEVVEQGTHEQLLSHKSTYYHLIQVQQVKEATEGTETEDDDVALEPTQTKESRRLSRVHTTLEETTGKLSVSDHHLPHHSLWELVKFTARFNKAEWHLLLLGLICSVIGGGGNPLQAVFFAKEISALSLPPSQYSELKSQTSFWALMFLVLAISQLLAFAGQGVLFAICSERLVHRVRAQSFEAMLRQDISFFDKTENTAGTLTSFLSTETTQLAGLSGMTLGTILTAMTSLFASLILAIAIGWKLGLVCAACVPVLVASGFFRFWLLARFEQRVRKAYEASASYACEAASSIRTVASLTRERAIWQQYHQQIEDQERKSLKSIAKTSALFACSQSFVFLVNALGFWYGGTLLGSGEYSIFQFFVTFTAVLFGTEGAGVVFAFAPDIAKAKVAASEIKVLLERPVLIGSGSSLGEKVPNMEGRVELKNVQFRYPTRPDQRVLRNISLTAEPNQYIALVGASGCGKSTVLALLERFYDPVSGSVLVDGRDISTLNVGDYRQHVAIVSQEPTLYQGTVRDNILMGVDRDDVSEDEIIKACKAANAYDFVMSLPDGFKTHCGSKGTLLSGGQKQRIAIARALVRNPKILLLDEATSALDSESEKIVQAALDTAAKGRTTIAVAHRLSTIQRADVIYVFDAGYVVEKGTHDELMGKRGKYYELVNLQSLT